MYGMVVGGWVGCTVVHQCAIILFGVAGTNNYEYSSHNTLKADDSFIPKAVIGMQIDFISMILVVHLW